MDGAQDTIRLDKWLWYARICKTRGQAADLVASGKVRLNSVRVTKPATRVRPGDGLSFALHGRVKALRIIAIPTRRGPFAEARDTYESIGEDVPVETPGP